MRTEESLGLDSLNQLQRRRSRGPVEPTAADDVSVYELLLRGHVLWGPADWNVPLVMLEKFPDGC